jgi:arsenite methyltransferase
MGVVSQHYGSAGIVERVLAAIPGSEGPDFRLKAPDLFRFDQLHGRELVATKEHVARLSPKPSHRILDIGSGIGGPARYMAHTFGCHVIGIDVTPQFVAAASQLTEGCGLSDLAEFHELDAVKLPFEDASFDAATCLYVGMNLNDKPGVIREAYRVLKPGGRLIWTEVVLAGDQCALYPLPWARDENASFLVSAEDLANHFDAAGFTISVVDETEAIIEHARQRAAGRREISAEQRDANQIIMGPDFAERRAMFIRCVAEGRLNSVLIDATR